MSRRRPGLAAAVLQGAVAWVLYLVLISSVSPLELGIGAGFAVLAATAGAVLGRNMRSALRPVRPLPAVLAAWPLALLRELGVLAAAVAGAVRGRAPRDGFRSFRLREDAGAGWATGLLSATPGSYVVSVAERGPRAGEVVLHAVAPQRSAVERVLDGDER